MHDDGAVPAEPAPAPAGDTELVDQLLAWVKVAADTLDDAAEAVGVAEPVRQAPYAGLGAALGVGYVLGGGLFSPTTGRLLRLGLKLATIPSVQATLLDLAEAAIDGVLARPAPPPR
jgi:hypothetical protein